MTAHAVGAGDGMHDQSLVLLIQVVNAAQRRMHPEEPAHIEQSIGLPRPWWHDLAAQRRQPGVAVRHHRRHAVQRPAQDDDDQALVSGCVGQSQCRASDHGTGGNTEQGGAAG